MEFNELENRLREAAPRFNRCKNSVLQAQHTVADQARSLSAAQAQYDAVASVSTYDMEGGQAAQVEDMKRQVQANLYAAQARLSEAQSRLQGAQAVLASAERDLAALSKDYDALRQRTRTEQAQLERAETQLRSGAKNRYGGVINGPYQAVLRKKQYAQKVEQSCAVRIEQIYNALTRQ